MIIQIFLLCWLMIVRIEARFEDFVINDKNDLKRFGQYDASMDESYEMMIDDEFLSPSSENELDVMDMFNGISMDDLPPEVLQKLEQYFGMMDGSSCLSDDGVLMESGYGIQSSYGGKFYDTLQLE